MTVVCLAAGLITSGLSPPGLSSSAPVGSAQFQPDCASQSLASIVTSKRDRKGNGDTELVTDLGITVIVQKHVHGGTCPQLQRWEQPQRGNDPIGHLLNIDHIVIQPSKETGMKGKRSTRHAACIVLFTQMEGAASAKPEGQQLEEWFGGRKRRERQ